MSQKSNKEIKEKPKETSLFKPGSTVKIISLNKYAEVLTNVDKKGFVKLRFGTAELKISIENLSLVSTNKTKVSKNKPLKKFKQNKLSSKKISVDLHGQTKEEAKESVLNILNKASLEGADSIEIIHGIGSYTLKNYLSELLKEIKIVKSFNLDSLNNGKTIVWLG